MLEHQGSALAQPHDGEGFILLDVEGHVVQTNLKGQEYLALLAGVGVGETLTHLGEQSFQELSRSQVKQCHEVILGGPACQSFSAVIQPVLNGAKFKGWMLVIHEVSSGQQVQALLEPQEQPALVVHWPPASPLTSNLP